MQRRLIQTQQMYKGQAQQAIAQQRDEMTKLELAIAKEKALSLEKQLDDARRLFHETKLREVRIEELLKKLLEGMKLRGVEAPGYEEAVAFFVQEQMLVKAPVTFAFGAGGGGGATGGTGGAAGHGFLGIDWDESKR